MQGGAGAQELQGAGEGVTPGPACGQAETGSALGVDESSGHAEVAVSDGLGDDGSGDAQADAGEPADEVVGQGGAQEPGAVGAEVPGWAVLQAGAVFEVADREFDDGVVAVPGIDGHGVGLLQRGVGEEGVVDPGFEQDPLVAAVVTSAAHHETPSPVRGLGNWACPFGV